jgi:acyl-CoA synthetase (AMP-forming)/AMP-acid ligase II
MESIANIPNCSQDSEGFVSFHDRLGDTYRVKGHNISTTEVEGALVKHPQIESVNVYGIPMNHHGYDGQLGCAAVTLSGGAPHDHPLESERKFVQNLEHELTILERSLPTYAVPRFLRILVANDGGPPPDQGSMNCDAGGERVSLIMKKLKTGLRKEGFSTIS